MGRDDVHGGPVHEDPGVPAWRRHTDGETIVGVAFAVSVAAALQWFLAPRLTVGPRALVPSIALVLLVLVVSTHPHRMHRRSTLGRILGLTLLAVIAAANLISGIRLVLEIVGKRTGSKDPVDLLLCGAAIWVTNVIVFALLYWEFDRGGPGARAIGTRDDTDFLFPQMQDPQAARPGWEPALLDYLYLAFTNATAFSPTDVMPLTRPAKMAMMVQSALSLALIGLVIARAVNILAT
jgi:uncharacterized membrane protein